MSGEGRTCTSPVAPSTMIGVAGIGDAGGVGDLADRGDAERARDDGDVRVRAAFLQHQPAQALAVVFEQRRRAHRARHDHGVLRQPVARRRVVLAEQLVHQPVRQFVEIVQALAQIGIGRAQHAGAGVGLHALDRGFGGQAGASPLRSGGAASRGHRRTCGRLPARRDARRRRHLAALEHHVEVGAHGLDRGFEPLHLLVARRRR